MIIVNTLHNYKMPMHSYFLLKANNVPNPNHSTIMFLSQGDCSRRPPVNFLLSVGASTLRVMHSTRCNELSFTSLSTLLIPFEDNRKSCLMEINIQSEHDKRLVTRKETTAASHAAGSGSIPDRVNFLVEVFS